MPFLPGNPGGPGRPKKIKPGRLHVDVATTLAGLEAAARGWGPVLDAIARNPEITPRDRLQAIALGLEHMAKLHALQVPMEDPVDLAPATPPAPPPSAKDRLHALPSNTVAAK